MKKTRMILLALILVSQVALLIAHHQQRKAWAENEVKIERSLANTDQMVRQTNAETRDVCLKLGGTPMASGSCAYPPAKPAS